MSWLLIAMLCLLTVAAAAAEEYRADVVVVGADAGGTGAALALARAGRDTILIAEGDWLGGMMTSGGIGAFDGHPTSSNSRALAAGLFGLYRRRLTELYYGPNSGLLDNYEPAVGARVLAEMMKEIGGPLRVLWNTHPVACSREGRQIVAVTVAGAHNGVVRGRYFVDGTDTGELVGLARLPYDIGTEDRSGIVMAYSVRTTGLKGPQAYIPFAADSATGEEIPPKYYAINYPYYQRDYESRREWWLTQSGRLAEPPGIFNPWGRLPVLGNPKEVKWDFNGDANDITLDVLARCLATDPEVGSYFRDAQGSPIPARANHSLVRDDPTLDEPTRAKLLAAIDEGIRMRSLGLLYFIRHDLANLGGREWGLANDYGTADHLPPKLYLREGRRIDGLARLTEYDIDPDFDKDRTAARTTGQPVRQPAAIAIQDYAIDIHRTNVETPSVYIPLAGHTGLYQVPYGTMIPKQTDNLLVTSAISVTHIAYGSLRMDPLRMIMGEAAAVAIDLCLRAQPPTPVQALDAFVLQREIIRHAGLVAYFKDVPHDPQAGFVEWRHFVPTQILGVRGDIAGGPDTSLKLWETMTRGEFAALVVRTRRLTRQEPRPGMFEELSGEDRIVATTLAIYGMLPEPPLADPRFDQPLTRAELARWICVSTNRPPTAGEPLYPDLAGHPSAGYVRRLEEGPGAPVIEPLAPGIFGPDIAATRGVALTAVQRALFPAGFTRPELPWRGEDAG